MVYDGSIRGDAYLEVVNEGLHALLHGRTRGRGDLVVIDLDSTGRHLVETLEEPHGKLLG